MINAYKVYNDNFVMRGEGTARMKKKKEKASIRKTLTSNDLDSTQSVFS